MNITEVMTANVDSCAPGSSFNEVAAKMKDLDVGVIPICDNEKLLGLVTDRDLVVKGLANNMQSSSKVSELMTEHIVTGTKNMSVEEAAQLMSQHQIRRLPIVDNEKLVGIVSLGDLAVHHKSNERAGSALEDISVPTKPH